MPLQDEDLPLQLSVRRSRWGELKGIRSRTAIWKLVTGLCRAALAHAHGRLRRPYAKGLAQAVGDGLDASATIENIGQSDLRTFRQYVDDEPLERALATQLARARATR
ncbi:hypothetical protein [Paraburkholderia lacunae]|uniref:Uncharacterized protein n=1 Tax=Paraburkholderia lacunae TaxID=2211104 RepID=A0A370MVK0_9BURK|nr:hypothetical protein [Paraburkholderia lacunae]RDJ97403.1 hypothetical protein DLM46_37855 [Paraburkholderia lacunae]